MINKKHLKNVGPIRDCEPPHAHSPAVATGTVALRLRIDVHDANDDDDSDNAWQRGPLWPHGMGPKIRIGWSYRALKFCTKGDYIKSCQRDDKSPLIGGWFCSRDTFLMHNCGVRKNSPRHRWTAINSVVCDGLLIAPRLRRSRPR